MIIVVTDRKICAGSGYLDRIEAIAAEGPDAIILREKDLPDSEYKYLAIECARICSSYGVKFCINTFIRVAAAMESCCVQVSFSSLRTNGDLLKDFEEVWVSVHSLNESVEAEKLGATHLIYGNLFKTSSKPGAEGKGLVELEEICRTVHIPVFGIGGINKTNISSVAKTGCAGVCVRSAVMGSKNPSRVMKDLRSGYKSALDREN
jgi:thiamine-phosphate pyrophosphorylase